MAARRPPSDGAVGSGRDASKTLDGLLRWKLVARHKAGSLEAAVGAARTRNTALSFGVLLLMAITVGVLARTARRAERSPVSRSSLSPRSHTSFAPPCLS